MKVKATRRGFYGRLRNIGEVFEIETQAELGRWMTPVVAGKTGAKTKAKPKPATKPQNKPKAKRQTLH